METIFDDERYLIIKTGDYVVCFTKKDNSLTESFVSKFDSGEVEFLKYILGY